MKQICVTIETNNSQMAKTVWRTELTVARQDSFLNASFLTLLHNFTHSMIMLMIMMILETVALMTMMMMMTILMESLMNVRMNALWC